jgi:hypothetical protein
MSGGITQLVAIGAQDAHLVGNPEVSFFRSTYKRHTNFSQTVERQVIQGNVSNGGTSTVRFERKGDLLGYVYLSMNDGGSSVDLRDLTGPLPINIDPLDLIADRQAKWTDLVKKVELLIGGQVIDDQDAVFSTNLASELFAQNLTKSKNGTQQTAFYPLRFFFCENWQSSLPLVALQYHDVEIRITWGDYAASAYKTPGTPVRWDCYASFTYLDTAERTDFANNPQNMLIYQVQKAIASQSKVQELVFNHPIKFITSSNISTDTKTGVFSPSNKIKLQLNGTDIADFKFAAPHFTTVTTYYHVPYDDDNTNDLFVYPFCLDTSKLQPTGTLNFSRLDSARIVSQNDNIVDDVYACNYNILRIQNGMGGLMYAN